VTPNFSWGELACRCGCEAPPKVRDRALELAQQLEVIRTEVRGPVQIISGYRCERRNRTVGGAPNSRHLWGDAADIQVHGWAGRDLRELAELLIGRGKLRNGGIGTYAKKPLTLHYDLRSIAARWHH
jgi:zinc D-Ala-D-Ala carboxypeptidase